MPATEPPQRPQPETREEAVKGFAMILVRLAERKAQGKGNAPPR